MLRLFPSTLDVTHGAIADAAAVVCPTACRPRRAAHYPQARSQPSRARRLDPAGQRVAEIATALGCHPKTVRQWLHRFNAHGVGGLGDLPRSGRPRRLGEPERGQLIALVRQAPPGRLVRQADGALAAEDEQQPAQWTLDALVQAAHELGIAVGRSQIRRILLAEGARWRRTRSWTSSSDPEFVPKERRSSPSTRPRRPG